MYPRVSLPTIHRTRKVLTQGTLIIIIIIILIIIMIIIMI